MKTPFFVVAAMMCGAGALATVEYVHARIRRPAAVVEAESGQDPTVTARPDPGVTAARDPSQANLALLVARLGNVEQKLGELTSATANQSARAEAERAEEALVKPPRADQRTVAQQTTFDTANAVVEHAVQGGTWTDADQRRLREMRAELLPADEFALRGKLALAANANKLRDVATQPFFF